MAGSINLSLSQQFDSTGAPLDGGFLYFYAAGTTTPQTAYKDTSLTLAWPNPIELDSAGRVPAFYLADGQIKIRLANAAGVTQVAADNLLVVGASSGTGTPPSVDATTIFGTGDLKVRYGTGVHTGWVRANARTIGSGTSTATERANADCQTLFEFLWAADANLSVSTGRGATANADWVANKTITLPDWRGRALAGLDDMGNSAAGRLTATYFGTAATDLGAAGGIETSQLTSASQLPNVNFTGTTGNFTAPTTYDTLNINGLGGTPIAQVAHGQGTESATASVASGGTSAVFKTVSPMTLATIYLKL